VVLFIGGCGMGIDENLQDLIADEKEMKLKEARENPINSSAYYEKYFAKIKSRGRTKAGTSEIVAIDHLPKDTEGRVDWTTSVVEGYIDPAPSLDPDYVEDPPLDLNIFIEAKTPLMANVIFPHSIHTYWLSCSTCHPNIFLPEAGANPISMEEIFQGKWCGRCHGKVAFTFWPRANCTRCHIVNKGESLGQEHFK